MIELRLMSDDETREREEANRPYDEAEEQRKRAVAACEGHEWELELEDLCVGGLTCVRCPATVDDLYPDGHELICGEFDGVDGPVKVEWASHESLTWQVIPVDAWVEAGRSWTDCGWEYDATLCVEQRGPARRIDPPAGES